jgi:hypothetical protein
MTMPWNEQASGSTQPHEAGESDSLKLLPLWSIILAILVFVGSQWYFDSAPPSHRRPGTLPMHLIMGYMTSAALSSYILLIGYVSRDVKRRNMSAALWMLLVVVMPGGIGAVVYFLLRQPVMIRCPSCNTELAAGLHFCPQCRFQVAPVCGQCFRGVQITDAFCPQCGHDVSQDGGPARLHAYSDS